MKNENHNQIVVFSASLAKILKHKGYEVVDTCPNRKDKERSVYFFKDAPGLTSIIAEYVEIMRARKGTTPETKKAAI